MAWSRSIALAGALLAVAIAGCSDDQRAQRVKTVTVRETASASKPPPNPPVDRSPEPGEAISYIDDFYSLLNQYRYRLAWTLLPQPVKDEALSYASWRAGYRTNVLSQPSALRVVGASKNAVDVSLDLKAKDIDACTGARVTQWFSGTWSFVRAGQEWAPEDITMKKVSGSTPATDASGCAPAEPPPAPAEPAPAEPAPYTSPGYGGGDLDCDDVPETDFPVGASDPNGFDADGDGIGCES